MRFGILGGGFGLYGYLPALLQEGHEVALPDRYRKFMDGRSDLKHLTARVRFVHNDEEMFQTVKALVLAIRPADQEEKLPLILSSSRPRFLLLEKPLAPTPAGSTQMLSMLDSSGLDYRIGYTLLHTIWAEQLRTQGLPVGPWRIRWRFCAHHYARNVQTWKRHPSQGGGAVRFYGIHLLALLASFGYSEVVEATIAGEGDDCPSFTALLKGPGVPDCRIEVDSMSDAPGFAISHCNKGQWQSLVDIPDPFASEAYMVGMDVRVGLLMALISDVIRRDTTAPDWYGTVVSMWARLEAVAASSDWGTSP